MNEVKSNVYTQFNSIIEDIAELVGEAEALRINELLEGVDEAQEAYHYGPDAIEEYFPYIDEGAFKMVFQLNDKYVVKFARDVDCERNTLSAYSNLALIFPETFYFDLSIPLFDEFWTIIIQEKVDPVTSVEEWWTALKNTNLEIYELLRPISTADAAKGKLCQRNLGMRKDGTPVIIDGYLEVK